MIHRPIIVLLIVCTSPSNIWNIQGFGTDLYIRYNQQFLVKSQSDFQAYSKYNNSLIRFAPSLTLALSKIILLSYQTNIIILGPVTLTQFGIYIQNSSNIIVRDVRILNASIYGVFIYKSHQIIIDHCTILDASRTDTTRGKCIDLTEASSNVTISFNLMGYTYPIEELNKFKGLLIANFKEGPVSNVSIHHNIFYCNYQRSPEISTNGLFDMRENIIFNFIEYGSRIRNGAFGNFVRNSYIGGKKDPLVFNDDVEGIYSIGNDWLYNFVEERKIEDLNTYTEFSTPIITSSSKKETLILAGCLEKSRWETLVYSEIAKFIT